MSARIAFRGQIPTGGFLGQLETDGVVIFSVGGNLAAVGANHGSVSPGWAVYLALVSVGGMAI